MCNQRHSRIFMWGRNFRIDGCMRDKILDMNKATLTLGCCCGHGRYPETIIIKTHGKIREYNTGIIIPRTRNFYRQDADGYFYIPEISVPVVDASPESTGVKSGEQGAE